MKKSYFKKGVIVSYVLVFGFVFLILLGAILDFIIFQFKQIDRDSAWNETLYIAEAGLDYYLWCLNNGIEDSCKNETELKDVLEEKVVGSFQVQDLKETSCGQVSQREIIVSGKNSRFSDIERKIKVVYGRKTVASYSYLLNDNLWVGSDHEINGPFHSNNGIRFDGINKSIVSSALNDWFCSESFGCFYYFCPSGCKPERKWENGKWRYGCQCPGVFATTDNPQKDLFLFPQATFDFQGITIDLLNIKQVAQSYGTYFPPVKTIDRRGRGYHVIFKEDGSVEIRIVTKVYSTWGGHLTSEDKLVYGWDPFTIRKEYVYKTITPPQDCGLLFFEDKLVWPEGKVAGKITLAVADLSSSIPTTTNVVLNKDIDYLKNDGTCALTIISQGNILIGPNSENDLLLKGIYIAQNGRFGRNFYEDNYKYKLEIIGSIVSAKRVGTKWFRGSLFASGYAERETYIDPKIIYSAPVFTPIVDFDFKRLYWQVIK